MMNKFLNIVSALLVALPLAYVPAAVQAGTSSHNVCEVPGTELVTLKSGKSVCIKSTTDVVFMSNSTYLGTTKKVQVRQDNDPKCDGKPSGFMYDVDIVSPDGAPGVGHVRCD